MQIIWNGLGNFVISGKPIQGDVTITTDPYEDTTGLRFPRTIEASIIAQSHKGPFAKNTKAVMNEEKKKPFLVDHAGEFEVQGVFVTGVRAPKKDGSDHTIYRMMMEDMNIAFLGALDRALTDKEIAGLGNIDILIVPVGGGDVMGKDTANEVVAQVEPRLVIPSYHTVPGLKSQLEDVEGFCKELACPREDMNKLKITKSGLPSEDVRIVVLSK